MKKDYACHHCSYLCVEKLLKHCLTSRPFTECLMTSCPPPMAWPPISTLSAHSFSLFLSIGYERLSLSIENRNMLCRTYYNSRGVPQTVPPRWDTFFGLADHGRILRWDTLVVSEVVTRRWWDTSFGQADV